MAARLEAGTVIEPPLRLSRRYMAPRALVFEAWTRPEHVSQWFAPRPFSVPEARIEPKPGGAFDITMRGPDGSTHFVKGSIVEFVPDIRLAIDMRVEAEDSRALFGAHTVAEFSDAELGGTQLDVTQSYTVIDPDATWMISGAPEGWRAALDQLAGQIGAMQIAKAGRSVVHSTFRLERRFKAPVGRVFEAFADPESKAQWFPGQTGKWKPVERSQAFVPGGREILKCRWESGLITSFEAIYFDIVPERRIVYGYDLYHDARKLSVSLATIALEPDGAEGTRLVMTEQGAFLDGYEDAGSREHGTGILLDQLQAAVEG